MGYVSSGVYLQKFFKYIYVNIIIYLLFITGFPLFCKRYIFENAFYWIKCYNYHFYEIIKNDKSLAEYAGFNCKRSLISLWKTVGLSEKWKIYVLCRRTEAKNNFLLQTRAEITTKAIITRIYSTVNTMKFHLWALNKYGYRQERAPISWIATMHVHRSARLSKISTKTPLGLNITPTFCQAEIKCRAEIGDNRRSAWRLCKEGVNIVRTSTILARSIRIISEKELLKQIWDKWYMCCAKVSLVTVGHFYGYCLWW